MALITGLTEMDIKYRDVYNFIVTKYDKYAEFSSTHMEGEQYYTPYAIISFRCNNSYMIISVIRQKLTIGKDKIGNREYTQIRITDKEGGKERLYDILSAFGGVAVLGEYNFKFIEKQDGYEVSDFVKERMEIERVLSPNMDNLCKVFVASEIVKNKDDILRILEKNRQA